MTFDASSVDPDQYLIRLYAELLFEVFSPYWVNNYRAVCFLLQGGSFASSSSSEPAEKKTPAPQVNSHCQIARIF